MIRPICFVTPRACRFDWTRTYRRAARSVSLAANADFQWLPVSRACTRTWRRAVAAARNTLSSEALLNVRLTLPALAVGALLGVMLFRRVRDRSFRGVVLGVLAVSGLLLAA